MNRTAAGVRSRMGIRKSAVAWSSTETPSQTFELNPRAFAPMVNPNLNALDSVDDLLSVRRMSRPHVAS